mmetsp:Transcript_18688/g.44325  ORF Transcript_18688/g.44325 Transcript_18688/m.44325 type:complete len:93 (-) Transcript_18688:78-356(-)
MSRFASATSTLARMASTRAAAAPKQTRSLMGRPGNMWSTFAKDFGEEHSWPFVAGMVLTGVMIWKITPSSTSEYAKTSKFQQRCDGTFKHEH